MPTFTAKTTYLGERLEIETDDFAELHEALAGIQELKEDARYLRRRAGLESPAAVVAEYREVEDHKYFGVASPDRSASITYGKKKGDGHLIPFFPKGEEGWFTRGDGAPSSSASGGASPGAPPDRPRPPADTAESTAENADQNADDGADDTERRPDGAPVLAAEDVRCPQCSAQAYEPCTNTDASSATALDGYHEWRKRWASGLNGDVDDFMAIIEPYLERDEDPDAVRQHIERAAKQITHWPTEDWSVVVDRFDEYHPDARQICEQARSALGAPSTTTANP